MKNGNIENSSLGQLFQDPTDVNSPILVPNQSTGMNAIDKTQRSRANSNQGGWGSLSYSESNSVYSNTDSDFIDLNGDRYPDMLLSNNIQTTTMTGGHKNPSGDYGINPINGNDNNNSAISRTGSVPVAGRQKQNETKSDNGRPDFALGLGLSLNLDFGTFVNLDFVWVDFNSPRL